MDPAVGDPAAGGPGARGAVGPAPDAVLFDRDGTLIVDVPYNGDPERVVPLPGAEEAVALLRSRGIPVGVVSNQSGVARGLLTRRQVDAVRQRVEGLLGPFGVWAVCPHGPDDGCGCRKPAPGLVLAACAKLGARPSRTVVIGDIGSDMAAARAAGARGVLVPTPVTLPEEIAAAPRTAPDLMTAVRVALGVPSSGSSWSSSSLSSDRAVDRGGAR
ncbi:D-glycero-alpha-D-manno-heptose-1,7-bisphosphate 7-phosphatase [Streptomyces sp. NPDC012769]|uniref:D-glycero-alpha-D-manno-heptose-1,7-bisphosphate 7-phosphatase n=1 Tax=Streptomyces sp. NPDC012769 TaxID=3364848 RepID=UPI0036C5DF66